MSLKKEKKIVQLHEIVRIYVEHMCTFINKQITICYKIGIHQNHFL